MKNIVFDIGNVLLDFNPKGYLNKLFHDEKIINELHNQIFLSDEWIELDKGTMTQIEAVEIFKKRNINLKDEIQLCMEKWHEILTPKEEIVQILKRIDKEKHNIYLLSNFHSLAYEYVISKYDFFQYFSGGIISYKERLVKPDDNIYRCLIERFDLNAEESVFIDDTLANTEAAERNGFKTIQFINPDQLFAELLKYNICFK